MYCTFIRLLFVCIQSLFSPFSLVYTLTGIQSKLSQVSSVIVYKFFRINLYIYFYGIVVL